MNVKEKGSLTSQGIKTEKTSSMKMATFSNVFSLSSITKAINDKKQYNTFALFNKGKLATPYSICYHFVRERLCADLHPNTTTKQQAIKYQEAAKEWFFDKHIYGDDIDICRKECERLIWNIYVTTGCIVDVKNHYMSGRAYQNIYLDIFLDIELVGLYSNYKKLYLNIASHNTNKP